MMKDRNYFLFFLIITCVLLAILLLISIFVRQEIISKYVLYFSEDKIVKASTIDAVNFKIRLILALLLSANIFLILLFRLNIPDIKKKISSLFRKIKWQGFFGFIKCKKTINLLLILLCLYFIGISLILVFNMDIGTDEGFYISSVKYFYEEGRFNLPWRNYSSALQQLTYYPFYLIRQFLGFSKYSLKIVVLVYSSLLLLFLFFVYKRNYSLKGYLVFLTLLVSNSLFIFFSSSGYAEIPAFLSFILALYIWTKGKKDYGTVLLTAFLFALAGLTKLQVLPFTILLIILFIIFQKDRIRENIILLISTGLFWFIGAVIFGLIQGYSISDIGRRLWILSVSSHQIAGNFSALNRLSRFNAFFSAFNLIIFSVVISYYIKNFRKVSLFEKALFIFSLSVSIWWMFFFPGLNIRNAVYSMIGFYMLFSMIIVDILKKVQRSEKNVYVVSSITLFLFLNLANGFITEIRLTKKGKSDEFLFANVGYETFSRKEVNGAQQEFFHFINEDLEPDRDIFYIGADYGKYIFTDRDLISVRHNIKDLSFPPGSYFILTYIDYKGDYVWDDLLVYLNNNGELLFKKDYYEVYKIVK